MPNEETKRYIEEKLRKHRLQVTEEMERIRKFSEAYLLVLLDLAMTNNPQERLSKVLKAVSADFPQQILEIYVKRSVSRAKESMMTFEDFADCLINGLGNKAKELRLTDEITMVYGLRAGERWKDIMRNSGNLKNSHNPNAKSPNSSCKCKTSP